jgi:predicted nucleic acid-binding Zn ribbon protein
MIYEWKCANCGNTQSFSAPIDVGPPEEMICEECQTQMNRIFSTNVVFKGEGWPGKDIRIEKTGEHPGDIEAHEKRTEEKKQEQENSNEVLAERRKGKKSFQEYKKRHPDKVDKYRQALAKGVKGE